MFEKKMNVWKNTYTDIRVVCVLNLKAYAKNLKLEMLERLGKVLTSQFERSSTNLENILPNA